MGPRSLLYEKEKAKSEGLTVRNTPTRKSPKTFTFTPSSVKKSDHLTADRHGIQQSDEETKSTSRASPITSGQHTPQKKHGAFLDNLSHPFASKEKEFDHDIFTDTQLENFLIEVKELKKKMANELKNDRVTKFNDSIKKQQDLILSIIVEKTTMLEYFKSPHIKYEKKLILADNLQKKHNDFIMTVQLKIKKYEKRFLDVTLHELYNQLKQIIVNRIWNDNVSTFGGKSILDQNDSKITVPTGIEKMIRVLADLIPIPKNTGCSINFFNTPTPVSRAYAERNEILPEEELIRKIIKLRSVAIERLNINPDNSRATYSFYHALKIIDPAKLLNLETLELYLSTIADLNGKYSVLSFQSGDSQAPGQSYSPKTPN